MTDIDLTQYTEVEYDKDGKPTAGKLPDGDWELFIDMPDSIWKRLQQEAEEKNTTPELLAAEIVMEFVEAELEKNDE